MTVKGPDGKRSMLVIDYTIVGREVVNFQECPLETFVIDAQTTFADSRVQKRRANFSPVLRTFVRWTIADEGRQPVPRVYDRIEPSP
jgi:hypothetical protein